MFAFNVNLSVQMTYHVRNAVVASGNDFHAFHADLFPFPKMQRLYEAVRKWTKNSQHSGFFYSQSIAHDTVFIWMCLKFHVSTIYMQLNVVETNHKTYQVGCFCLLTISQLSNTKKCLKCNTWSCAIPNSL